MYTILNIEQNKKYIYYHFIFCLHGIRAALIHLKNPCDFFFSTYFFSQPIAMSDVSFESNLLVSSSSPTTKPTTQTHNTESHPVQITTIRLNGDNFLRWSQSVRMYLRGRGKIGYLTGDKVALASEDPLYTTWDAENSMVMTWLMTSMNEETDSNYMCYSTAKELWDNVNQMYSDLGNQS